MNEERFKTIVFLSSRFDQPISEIKNLRLWEYKVLIDIVNKETSTGARNGAAPAMT